MVPDVFIVNELTAARFLLSALRRRPTQVLAVSPVFPPLHGALVRLVDWAKARGGTSNVIVDLPEFKPMTENITLVYAADPFRKLEGWQADYFDYPRAECLDPPYAMAYKLAAGKYFHWKYVSMFLLEALTRKFPERRVFGISTDLLALARAYFGPASLPRLQANRLPRRLINACSLIGVTMAAVGWIAGRTRWSVKTRDVFIAADVLNDPRDKFVFDELSEGGDIVIVPRNPDVERHLIPEMQGYVSCPPRQGFFRPRDAAQGIREVLIDGLHLYRVYGAADPELFYQIATFPFRRLNYRALFIRYRPKFFWGRDDYQVEHILRRGELHRIGAKSLGISHAVQGICILKAMWRWISFDIYYVWARIIHRHYRDTWSADMTVRLTGSFGFSRAQLTGEPRREKVILVMTRYVVGDPEAVKLVRGAAAAFPEYRIWVQAKAGYAHERLVPDFVAACSTGLENVTHVGGDPYALVRRASFVVSDASSIISECLQIGVPTLMFDILANHETCLYREFPGLCTDSAEAALTSLTSFIREGRAYPFERYGDLYNDSGRLIYDIIRADVGLPAKAVAQAVKVA